MEIVVKKLLAGAGLLLALGSCTTSPAAPEPAARLGALATCRDCGGGDGEPEEPEEPGDVVTGPTLPGTGQNIRIRVVIDKIQVFNTEDVTGGDEFYLHGVMGIQQTNGVKVARPFVVPPMTLHAGETRVLNLPVFEAVLPPGTAVSGQVAAYDEDIAKDWYYFKQNLIGAAYDATKDLATSTRGLLSYVGMGLNGGLVVIDQLLGSDKDDRLASFSLGYNTLSYNMWSSSAQGVRFSQPYVSTTGYSTWDYVVFYRTEVERTTGGVSM